MFIDVSSFTKECFTALLKMFQSNATLKNVVYNNKNPIYATSSTDLRNIQKRQIATSRTHYVEKNMWCATILASSTLPQASLPSPASSEPSQVMVSQTFPSCCPVAANMVVSVLLPLHFTLPRQSLSPTWPPAPSTLFASR